MARQIEGLVWMEANEEKLAGHGISRVEVEDMIYWGRWEAVTNARYPGQIRVIGYTTRNRWLTVAMERGHERTIWRPVTGWPSMDTEVNMYYCIRRQRR